MNIPDYRGTDADFADQGIEPPHKEIKIPFRWRLRWFLRGMASAFGYRVSVEQQIEEAKQCVDEMITTNKLNSLPELFIFFREDGFYPILLPKETVVDNAECNPGTLRVENGITGEVVWTVTK